METGDWGSNKQLAWYPLTVAGKVAMLRFAEREHWKGKNEMEGHRMLSVGKKFHLGIQTLPHSKTLKPPTKNCQGPALQYPLPNGSGNINIIGHRVVSKLKTRPGDTAALDSDPFFFWCSSFVKTEFYK